jgi:hypothetical protein
VAFSVPVVAAGVAVTHFGLHRTALGYGAAIVVLTAVAAGSLILRRRLHGATPEPALVVSMPRAQGGHTPQPGCG